MGLGRSCRIWQAASPAIAIYENPVDNGHDEFPKLHSSTFSGNATRNLGSVARTNGTMVVLN
jgi:hypothetical protein